jgi:hypothetical protein
MIWEDRIVYFRTFGLPPNHHGVGRDIAPSYLSVREASGFVRTPDGPLLVSPEARRVGEARDTITSMNNR